MSDGALERIRVKLARLAGDARLGRPHGFELGPPLDEDEVAAFEREHGITLPADYRAFLLELGAEGAGPGWGLVALDAWGEAWADLVDGEAPPTLARPSSVRPDAADGWSSAPGALARAFDGWLTLCDHGAERWWLLEVTGPRRGRLWRWDGVDAPPQLSDAPDFTTWYERWLDDSIADLDDALFGVFRGGSDTDLLLRLSRPDPRERAEASIELGRRRAPSAAVIAGIREALVDPDPEVRAAALRHAERAALPEDVLRGLDDADREVRRAAAFLLRRVEDAPDATALATRLDRAGDPAVLSILGLTLAERGALDLDALAGPLAAPDPALRARAHLLLARAAPREPAVERAIAGLTDPAPEVRTACATALEGAPEAREALRARLAEEPDPAVRRALERMLGPGRA